MVFVTELLPHLCVCVRFKWIFIFFYLQAMAIYSSLSKTNAQFSDTEQSGDQAVFSDPSESFSEFDKENSFDKGDSAGPSGSKKP